MGKLLDTVLATKLGAARTDTQEPVSWGTHFDIVAGTHKVEFQGTNELGSKQCADF